MTARFDTSSRPAIPLLGQGTWNLELAPRAEAVRALRTGLDLGLSHVDTAEMYGDGEAERLVGEAIAGRRDEVYLVSKVLPHNASRAGTLRAAEQSLQRLGTERLDLYLLHWPGPHPLEETFAAFEELRRRGDVAAWGVSNFDADELEHAAAVAGPGRLACDQVLYHLEERAIEHAVVPRCRELDVAVVAYSPFGSGAFPAADSPGGRVLADVARRHGATPRQVALARLMRAGTIAVIPKSARAEHVTENAGARDLTLSEDDVALLDAAFPLGPRPRSLPMI